MTEASGLLFVGQGAQTVGMTKDVLDLQAVKDLYLTAKTVLGYDLQEICLNGPSTRLEETVVAQPALLLAGLAAFEKLKQESPEVVKACQATAGLSLGEYTALVAGGALTFHDALMVVKVRAEAMQKAADHCKGTMMTVVGLGETELAAACKQAASTSQCLVQISNYLFPKGLVVGGEPDAIAALKTSLSAKEGLIIKELQVSGAFHTPLMEAACHELRDVLNKVEIKMPSLTVYSNVTGRPYKTVDEIRESLVQQIVQPVLWQATLEAMLGAGVTKLYDMGPRQTIKAMVRKINLAAWKKCVSIDV